MHNSRIAYAKCVSFVEGAKRLYFGGILGASMSSLARLLWERGYEVAGCDRRWDSPEGDALRRAGILVEDEMIPHLLEGDLVVYTLALGEDAPLIQKTGEMGLPCISRAQLLGVVMGMYGEGVAVSGTHGKSTTVGMLSAILTESGLSPTIAGGAPLDLDGASYRKGGDSLFLTEGCEYKDSFLSLSPSLGIVTNVEYDHPDYFPSLEAVKGSFLDFMARCKQVCVNISCRALAEICPKRAYTYGFSPNAYLRGQVTEGGLLVYEGGVPLGEVTLKVRGSYQRENALSAIAGARCLGVPFPTIQKGLEGFLGIGRRLEKRGSFCGAEVYLDYAHHPTQIKNAVDALSPYGEVYCIYQPHTYTRTAALWGEFASALRLPDACILIDIYPAREAPMEGVSSKALAKAAGVAYAPTLREAKEWVRGRLKKGNLLLLMGAGDIADGISLFLEG